MLVTGIHYRHPAVLANMAATLDIISGGRLELGIGAGWNEEESGAYGIELGTLKERFDRFDEACEVLIGLLTQGDHDFRRHVLPAHRRPLRAEARQQPHPPICIGGSGEKRTLRTVARFAQHWNFAGGPPEEFARKRDVLAAHCADIGRDPTEIMLSTHLRLGPEDRDSARSSTRPPRSARRVWTWRSSTCRRRTIPACSSPSPRRIEETCGLFRRQRSVTITKISTVPQTEAFPISRRSIRSNRRDSEFARRRSEVARRP